MTAYMEPSLASGGAVEAKADDKFQFGRHGCFVADRVDHAAGKPAFNLYIYTQVRNLFKNQQPSLFSTSLISLIFFDQYITEYFQPHSGAKG